MGSLSFPKTRQNDQLKMLTATTTSPSRLLLRPPPPNYSKPLNALSTTTSTTQDSGLLFREKLLYLSSLRINLHKALTLNPNLRSTPLSSLQSIYQCLSSMGLTRQSIGRILDMHPSILTSDPDFHLYPILDFLISDVNIPFLEVSKSITRCPRMLVSSVDTQLRPALLFLQSLGFVGPNAINSQTTVLLVYNVEFTLMAKIEYLMSLGFECEEVKNMAVRSPGLLTFSVERNLGPKVRYFLEEMKGDLKELKRFPQYFSFSLEKKIKPRHRMLVEKGLKGVPLSRMLRLSDEEFNARLVDMQLRMAGEEGVNVKNREGQVYQW